jgi:hypothetical protein
LIRPRVFLLLAAVLALASTLAACGGGDAGSPQEIVDEATFEGIESGVIDLSLAIDIPGEKGGSLDASVSGPFESQGKDKLPSLDLTAKVQGTLGEKDIDFDGGLVLLPNKAFVNYEGVDYEVDPFTYGFVEELLNEGQGQSGESESSEVTACQEAASEIDPGEFIEDPIDGGSVETGGTSTTKVSGDLNVPKAFDALIELAEDPACEAQLGKGGPGSSIEELEERRDDVEAGLESAHVELFVGDDGIVRRLSAELALKPDEQGGASQSIDVDIAFSDVNEDQEIVAPRPTKPLGDLFLKLNINPLELAESAQNGIGSLIERLGGALLGESSGGGAGSGGGGKQSYFKCLQEVTTPADVLECGEQLR